jgi:hypothetical protein
MPVDWEWDEFLFAGAARYYEQGGDYPTRPAWQTRSRRLRSGNAEPSPRARHPVMGIDPDPKMIAETNHLADSATSR